MKLFNIKLFQIPEESMNLNGINPKISVTKVTTGGVVYNPIGGDMLATPHEKPQVSVNQS